MGRCCTLPTALQWGLPSQIKDEIAHVGKPNTLDKLWTLAQTINARYWEHCSEVACETSRGKTQEQQNDKGKSPATVKIKRVYSSSVVCREWCLAQPPTIVRQIEVEGVNKTGCMCSLIKYIINDYKRVKSRRI
jgi:hypothetical protein